MHFAVKLSEATAARRRVPVYLVDSTDGYTPEPGITAPTVEVSKNGGAQASGTGTFAEVGDGVYYYEFAAGEIDTLGWVNVRIAGTGCREYQAIVFVVAYDTFDADGLGLTRVDAAISSRSSLDAAGVRSAVGLASANLDTQLDAIPTSAELTTALAAADDAVLAAIAALNNLSAAGVRAAVGLASANLDTQLGDLPTNSELTAALAGADDAILAAIAALHNLSLADIRTAVGLASANLDTQLTGISTQATGANTKAADLQGRIPAALEGGRMASKLAADPPTVAQIDTQLSGTHGAGAWGGGSGSGSGEFDVEFTVTDSGTAAGIRRARITIRASDEATRVDQRDTSAAGVAAFNLDAEVYYYQVSAPGYQSVTLTELEVTADAEVSVALTPLPVSAPAAGDLCVLYDFLYVDGTPDGGQTVIASIALEDLPASTADVLLSGETRTATTDENGRWELQLIRGKIYRLTCQAYGLNERAVMVPDEDSATLRSLIAG